MCHVLRRGAGDFVQSTDAVSENPCKKCSLRQHVFKVAQRQARAAEEVSEVDPVFAAGGNARHRAGNLRIIFAIGGT